MGYDLFNKLMSKVANSLESDVPSILGYSKESIKRRLLQRLVEMSLIPFMNVAYEYVQNNGDLSFSKMQKLQFSGLTCHLSNGNINIGLITFLKYLLKFVAHWLLVLSRHIYALFCFQNIDIRSTTIVMGVGSECLESTSGRDAEFVEFCKQGPIKALRDATSLIIMTDVIANEKLLTVSDIDYAKYPLFKLVHRNGISLPNFLQFLIAHIKLLLFFIFATLRFPLLVIIGSDFSYHAMINRLNREGVIENIIITNSNYMSQPLWMSDLPDKLFHLHMIWYSENCIPVVYKWDERQASIPGYSYMKVDESWVWTEQFVAYLQGLGVPGVFHHVGPILFYLSNSNIKLDIDNSLQVTVFDVTPVSPDEEKGFGVYYNYYSSKNMSRFISDIVYSTKSIEKALNKSIQINLKHKRIYAPIHDRNYINLVRMLSEKDEIFVSEANTNLYELILNSDLVIVVPYSGPALVAHFLGVPVIYYDASEELVYSYYKKMNGVDFISGQAKLVQYLKSVLSG